MSRLLSPVDEPTYGRPGFVFRELSGAAQLWEYQARTARVLTLEAGRLRLDSYRHDCAPFCDKRLLDLRELCQRGAHPDRTADGQTLLFPLDPDAPAIHQFIRLIPDHIWQRVHTYPTSMGFQMLSLFMNVGEPALRLHDCGCHGLVALAACAAWLRGEPTSPEWVGDLLNRPQAEALGMLTLPATERVARIVRKVEPLACDYPLLRHLRVLHDKRLAREVSHLPKINCSVLATLQYCNSSRRLVTPACLRELSHIETIEAHAIFVVIMDHITRHRVLERLLAKRLPLPTHASVRSLLLASCAKRYRHSPMLRSRRKIPRPPFRDAVGFVHWIRTPGDLLSEAESMYNCVFTYLPDLIRGKAAVAMVDYGGERSTALVVRQRNRKWGLRDLRLRFNKVPTQEMRSAVAEWLAAQQVKPNPRKPTR